MRFAIDAISLTFKSGTAREIMDATERGFICKTPWDEAGLSWQSEELGYKGWAYRHTYAGGDITIMEGKGYCCWQVKSRACEVCQENITDWLYQAEHDGGANATRIDGVWAPVPFDPHEFLLKLRSEELCSTLKKHGAGWIDNTDGRTASLPPYSHRKSARFLRLYDKRGYNRLELQLNKPDADSCYREMNRVKVEEWPELWKEYLVKTVDFRTGPQSRITNRPRSAWWSDFVGEAKKASSSLRSRCLQKTLWVRRRGALSVATRVNSTLSFKRAVLNGLPIRSTSNAAWGAMRTLERLKRLKKRSSLRRNPPKK